MKMCTHSDRAKRRQLQAATMWALTWDVVSMMCILSLSKECHQRLWSDCVDVPAEFWVSNGYTPQSQLQQMPFWFFSFDFFSGKIDKLKCRLIQLLSAFRVKVLYLMLRLKSSKTHFCLMRPIYQLLYLVICPDKIPMLDKFIGNNLKHRQIYI